MPERLAVVLVHGFLSSAKTWSRMKELIADDPALADVDVLEFEYWSPIVKLNPFKKIPDYTAIADTLLTFLESKTADYRKVVLVTHSQGGLVVQRYLARQLSRGRGESLGQICQLVMYACPNNGSQVGLGLRKAGLMLGNPQERALRPLNDTVHDTRQIIHRQVVNATSTTASTARIPFAVFAGAEDGIVPLPSAQDVFPNARGLPGDHFTIIKPDSANHLSYVVLRRCLLAQLGQQPVAVGPVASGDWRSRALVEEDTLFGIEEPLARLEQWVTGNDHMFMVSIFGAGGAGKTTLAYEAVKRCAEPGGFTRIAWVSAKPSELSALGEVEQQVRTGVYWQELLIDIAGQLGLPIDLASARITETFGDGLRALDRNERCLIVVDNLETITDLRHGVNFLEKEAAVGAHRVVLTSRKSVLDYTDRVNQLEWNRLPSEPARQLVIHLGRNDPALGLGMVEIDDVVRQSGGNPLIIKLIVKLCIDRKQTVTEIVGRIQAESARGDSGLASYLYNSSIEALYDRVGRPQGVSLLNAFCGVSAGATLASEEFYRRSGLANREEFDNAKAAAGRLALLTTSHGNARFSVHPVLRAFICGGS